MRTPTEKQTDMGGVWQTESSAPFSASSRAAKANLKVPSGCDYSLCVPSFEIVQHPYSVIKDSCQRVRRLVV